MNIEEFRAYCLAKKGVTESIPFSKLPNVLVFKVLGKMFTATDITVFEGFSFKYYPEKIEALRVKYDAVGTQAYMSKKHWNNVKVDGSISDELLYKWIDISYDLVVAKLPKYIQKELNG